MNVRYIYLFGCLVVTILSKKTNETQHLKTSNIFTIGDFYVSKPFDPFMKKMQIYFINKWNSMSLLVLPYKGTLISNNLEY
jgi:hypothetical protein